VGSRTLEGNGERLSSDPPSPAKWELNGKVDRYYSPPRAYRRQINLFRRSSTPTATMSMTVSISPS